MTEKVKEKEKGEGKERGKEKKKQPELLSTWELPEVLYFLEVSVFIMQNLSLAIVLCICTLLKFLLLMGNSIMTVCLTRFCTSSAML